MNEPILKVDVNVQVGHRRFIQDPSGDIKLEDGTIGKYANWDYQQVHNLLTTAGRDYLHQQGYQTTGLGTNGGNYIGLSSDTNAAAAGDTTLTGEITNLGLNRAVGAVAHTNGQTTSTVSKTFTATGTSAAVQKAALFTAVSSGTMVHEATFSSVNLINGDQLAVTWTITLS